MKTSLLISKGFVIGLLILIINDFLLKSLLGNWFTGKLSDFAGLFIFPIFLTALFPKAIRFNYIFTVLFFVFWKTELSQPFINYINTLGFPASRVVDYTDLIAFVVLPFSYRYCSHQQNAVPTVFYQKIVTYLMGITAFVAFSATSKINKLRYEERHEYNVNETYKSKLTPTAFLDSVRLLSTRMHYDTIRLATIPDTLYIAEFVDKNQLDTIIKFGAPLRIEEVKFTIKKRRSGCKIYLLTITTNNNNMEYMDFKTNQKEAQKMAEKLMIEPLR
jgi:hypothetical protein